MVEHVTYVLEPLELRPKLSESEEQDDFEVKLVVRLAVRSTSRLELLYRGGHVSGDVAEHVEISCE